MKRFNGMIVPAVYFLLLLVAACGREQSTASKSAAAYRDAVAKGTPVGGGDEHGGHTVETSAVTSTATKLGETADHADHGTTQMSSSDHAAMGHSAGRVGHAGMQHGASGTPAEEHAQHAAGPSTPQGAVDPHAQHRAAPTVRPAMTTAPDEAIHLVSPLRGDLFDAPAPIAVSEAAKATQGGGHEGHQMRGITPGQDRENPPTPMPATRGQNRVGAPVDHGQHGGLALVKKK